MPKNFRIIKWYWLPVMVLLVVLGTTVFGVYWLSAYPADPPNPQNERDNPYLKLPNTYVCRDLKTVPATTCVPTTPNSWPAGCGNCTPTILPDLDNCPAGPSGAKCYNEFGIEISCKNSDQADWSLDLEGNICDPCGNRRLDAGEDCDGDNLAGRSCLSLGFSGGTLACDPQCKFDASNCFYCGNNKVDPGEECDLDNLTGKTCNDVTFGWTDTAVCANSKPTDLDYPKRCDITDPDSWASASVCGPGVTCVGGLTCLNQEDVSCRFGISNCCGDGSVGLGEYCEGNQSFPASAATVIRDAAGKIKTNFRSFMIANQCLVCGSPSADINQRCWPTNYRNCANATAIDDYLPKDRTKYIWISNSAVHTVAQMVALSNVVKVSDIWGETAVGGVCETNASGAKVACSGNLKPVDCGSCTELKDEFYEVGTIIHEYRICGSSQAVPNSYYAVDLAKGEGCQSGDTVVANNPSRTAVNTKTGEAWVVYRNGWQVGHFNGAGQLVKACLLGTESQGSGGGVAVDLNGDAWIGINGSGQIIKLAGVWRDETTPGASEDCTSLATVDFSGHAAGVYGMAITPANNFWVVGISREKGFYVENPGQASQRIVPFAPGAPGGKMYGVTTDQNGNAYINRWNAGLPLKAWVPSADDSYIVFDDLSVDKTGGVVFDTRRRRGAGIDLNGNIWVGGDGNSIERITKSSATSFESFKINGLSDPFGISGDTDGYIWAVQYSSIDKPVCRFRPRGTGKVCFASSTLKNATPYMYSDFLGMHRTMLLRTKTIYYPPLESRPLEAFDLSQDWPTIGQSWQSKWGKVLYQSSESASAKARVYVCSGDIETNVGEDCLASGGNWLPIGNPNGTCDTTINGGINYNCIHDNPSWTRKFLRLKIELESSSVFQDPAIWDLKIGCVNSTGANVCQ